MMNLNVIKKIDKSDMLRNLKNFPEHLENAVKLVKPEIISGLKKRKINEVVISGMGGSGIGGEILASCAMHEFGYNIYINRDYKLPKFVDKNVLVFIISYSGNTEETVSAFLDALKKDANIVCLTSDGVLENLTKKHNKILIKIPKGMQPREAVPYLLFPIASILEKIDIIKLEYDDTVNTLKNMRARLLPDYDDNFAEQVALRLKNKIPIIYAHSFLGVVAKRWKNQLNENSKIIAFTSEFPEMTHNEIVGLDNDENAGRFIHVLLRIRDENEKIKKKIVLTKKMVFKDYIEVYAEGKTTIAKMLSLVYMGDFVSYYLAILRNIDPAPVEIIEKLKSIL